MYQLRNRLVPLVGLSRAYIHRISRFCESKSGDGNLPKGEKMRDQSSLAAPARSQAQIMDEEYLGRVARQIIGECKFVSSMIPDPAFTDNGPQEFTKEVFQDVLHRVARMNPRNLGRILAHGLVPGQSSPPDSSGHRRKTPMSQGWFGTVENTVTGIMLLEWSATAVVVAAIYDILHDELMLEIECNEADGGPNPYRS